ncbi:surfeit locus protein 1 [Bombus vancouverensis nearcticus]|uniref:surfeit locus protein 1 n=1 Tax=Bombus vancouverensis nearcticus TaxID=2705178 RepID=UPI00143B94AA|nr:surfeit locus protein 1 [Bombus vancouverensis nearcticus]
MNVPTRRIFTKVGKPYNIIIVRSLSKETLSQWWYKLTNQKPNHKTFRSDIYGREPYESNYKSSEKISFPAYCLLSVPICTFLLGTWQVRRLKWKTDLVKRLKKRTSHEPFELPENLEDLETKEYYPIRVRGTFLYDKEFMAANRSLIKDGKPSDANFSFGSKSKRGYHIITPFKLADRDLTILVNRGWIPKTLKNSPQKYQSEIEDEQEIVGILRLSERRPSFVPKNRPHHNMWYYRDVYEMAEKADTSPIYLEMSTNNDLNQYPISGQTRVELRNDHLNYLLTWYCLSGATAYMWFWKFIKGIPVAH